MPQQRHPRATTGPFFRAGPVTPVVPGASSSSSKKSQLKSLKRRQSSEDQFAQIKEDIRELEDSDISGSSDESATSLFIMSGTSAHFCGEQRSDEDLDLTKGWLLDCQSTCDIACNLELLVPGSLRKSENNL